VSVIPEVPRIGASNLLSLKDLTCGEVAHLIKFAAWVKAHRYDSRLASVLQGRSIALIFEKPSTRTRVSFEVAIRELGGHPLFLSKSELQLARGEPVADTARVLSRYVHGIVARVYRHETLEELARYSTIPVINALSDKYHPCQILGDLLTIYEKFGKWRGVKVAWVGDGNNVCNSLLIGCAKVGCDIWVATPRQYRPHKEAIRAAQAASQETGARVVLTEDPEEAVRDADVVYTDVFVSMGMEEEREERLRTFMPRYQVTQKLVSLARPSFVFMHCLPAHRGEEVESEIIDGPHSIVWDQAENRLHAQKALLIALFAR